MAKFIVIPNGRSDIFQALHEAGVVADKPSDIARVIIDLKAGSPAQIYIQKFADDSLVDVILQGGLTIVEADAPGGDS